MKKKDIVRFLSRDSLQRYFQEFDRRQLDQILTSAFIYIEIKLQLDEEIAAECEFEKLRQSILASTFDSFCQYFFFTQGTPISRSLILWIDVVIYSNKLTQLKSNSRSHQYYPEPIYTKALERISNTENRKQLSQTVVQSSDRSETTQANQQLLQFFCAETSALRQTFHPWQRWFLFCLRVGLFLEAKEILHWVILPEIEAFLFRNRDPRISRLALLCQSMFHGETSPLLYMQSSQWPDTLVFFSYLLEDYQEIYGKELLFKHSFLLSDSILKDNTLLQKFRIVQFGQNWKEQSDEIKSFLQKQIQKLLSLEDRKDTDFYNQSSFYHSSNKILGNDMFTARCKSRRIFFMSVMFSVLNYTVNLNNLEERKPHFIG